MQVVNLSSVALFIFLLVTQIISVSLIPRTAGFTDPYWTAACVLAYVSSLWSLSYMIYTGMSLGLVIPILAATVPLVTIFIGIIFYKETASMLKIITLCGACGLIGIASSLK